MVIVIWKGEKKLCTFYTKLNINFEKVNCLLNFDMDNHPQFTQTLDMKIYMFKLQIPLSSKNFNCHSPICSFSPQLSQTKLQLTLATENQMHQMFLRAKTKPSMEIKYSG
eukprot:TRINITY_DN15817_c0_g1_i1.p1 TRINITY_DN15817_c0_g1~~TRINITY_DN15817_c0_g1_i1.p1  ORF type:complete len:110 (+),score=3.83 TRINITY_DN15817_c0_g1_i1:404-733(+)